MSKAVAVGVVGLALSASMLGMGFYAGSSNLSDGAQAAATAMNHPRSAAPADREAIEAIVRDYLLTNPDIFLEVQQVLQTREEESRAAVQQAAISDNTDLIYNAAHDGIIGNPAGDVTIVEFFDYNCGFCKRGVEDMDALVAADPDLRFVLKEFPILGPDSRAAHIVSMAFRSLAPDQYGAFHRDLMLGGGRATEASAIAAAVRHGVDEAALREEMQNPEITAAFERTFMLADSLSITGTPSYVVGSEVVFGALGQEVLAEKVAAARACPDGNC